MKRYVNSSSEINYPTSQIPYERVLEAEDVLINEGMSEDKAFKLVQQIGYALLRQELYPETKRS